MDATKLSFWPTFHNSLIQFYAGIYTYIYIYMYKYIASCKYRRTHTHTHRLHRNLLLPVLSPSFMLFCVEECPQPPPPSLPPGLLGIHHCVQPLPHSLSPKHPHASPYSPCPFCLLLCATPFKQSQLFWCHQIIIIILHNLELPHALSHTHAHAQTHTAIEGGLAPSKQSDLPWENKRNG